MPWLLKMTSVVALLMAPAQLYLSFRYFAIIKSIVKKSTVLSYLIPAILGSFYLYPAIALTDFYFTGQINLLTYPKILVYWFWLGLIFVYQLATWVILGDILKYGAHFLFGNKNVFSRWYPRVIATLFAAVFLFTAVKTYLHTTQVKAEHNTISVTNLPSSLEGFKIVHITDIQGDEYTGREEIQNYIQEVNAHNPDLIIFTGDLISYGTDFIQMSTQQLGQAKATFGIFAVVGDHDYWAGVEHVKEALNNQGIELLQDQNANVFIGDKTSITITGITEVYSKASNPSVIDSLTAISAQNPLKIFVSHQVNDRLVETAQNQDYNLMLAGHTHGGQIQVPFMGMNFSASQRETKYVQGFYWENGIPINVNNGLGFTLAPIRYEAPPNISVITLEKE